MSGAGDHVGLVVAKAPVPGQAKTRLAEHVGDRAAAELAAAALLDTLDVMRAVFPTVHVSLAGDLGAAARGAEVASALAGCEISVQRGVDLGARLAHAHASAAREGRLVVQVGMDTPQAAPALLREVCALANGPRTSVLGPAHDGGWWVLALRDPGLAESLLQVPMSRPDTGMRTEQALQRAGSEVRRGPALRDVDGVTDARAVATAAPGTRFAAAWAQVEGGADGPVGEETTAAARGGGT